MSRWGIVATIKAPADEILQFASHHLEIGAHRIFVYLDAPCDGAEAALRAHPKCRVVVCDDRYWRRLGGRPDKHQVRQSKNATHAYGRKTDVDWLIHIDVDEFLLPDRPLGTLLSPLPANTLCARVRPAEQLAGNGTHFKAFIKPGPDRTRRVEALYPTFGRHIRGGFLSHLAGKLFLRTGLGDVTIKIHNAFRGAQMNPGECEMEEIVLCHCHAPDWTTWQSKFDFRLDRGSYRAGLAPAVSADKGGLSLNDLFRWIQSEEGPDGLRAFFDEVVADTPRLRAALAADGLLITHDLSLETKVRRHFPGHIV